jgi:hypothetical protein
MLRTSDVIASSPAGFIQKVAVLGEAVTLYSHSYLGLGLMAARLAIMKKENPMWAEVCNVSDKITITNIMQC